MLHDLRWAALFTSLLLWSGCLGKGRLNEQSQTCASSGTALIEARCSTCHSAKLTGTARSGATNGINFDTPADVQRQAERVRMRALVMKDMPPTRALADCDQTMLSTYLHAVGTMSCMPACSGRTCGDDGCGGTCGACPDGQQCVMDTGECFTPACTPNCEGRTCGADGCGGTCGTCPMGRSCSAAGTCVCEPSCTGRECGDDGCGGTCGACPSGRVCSQQGTCSCVPSCGGHECGDDGCGGTCGACTAPASCDATGHCACTPDCTGRACGPDGCGGSCGTCQSGLVCNTQMGACSATCTPSCTGRTCGDNGCGGACGTCPGGQACSAAGQCQCVPNCQGRACGPDGCGGSCGTCATGLSCSSAGQCGCTPSCSGRVCGSDSCGGSCGTCPGGQACSTAGQCACTPSCAGKTCGPDGCGGTCGTCSSIQTCTSSQCAWPQKSFATDVFPMFQQAMCAGQMCHGGTRPSEGLDLSSASVALSQMLNVATGQCNGSRKRVVPGDPASSYLVNKLSGVGMCSGSIMPKMESQFTAAQLDTVRAWIASGANP